MVRRVSNARHSRQRYDPAARQAVLRARRIELRGRRVPVQVGGPRAAGGAVPRRVVPSICRALGGAAAARERPGDLSGGGGQQEGGLA
eukprot:scaffold1045_cov257-Prasinococcus_capsulatus_cf.AAC.2